MAAMAPLIAAPLLAAPAATGVPVVQALWNMNEPANATVMVDSSGNGLNGTINQAGLNTGVSFGGAIGYEWAVPQPHGSAAGARTGHLRCRTTHAGSRHGNLHRGDPFPHQPQLRKHHPEGSVGQRRRPVEDSRTPAASRRVCSRAPRAAQASGQGRHQQQCVARAPSASAPQPG